MKYTNVIWLANINAIGGVESVIWNVVRKYNYDIAVWYKDGDSNQLYRLSHYCKLIKFDPKETIECDRLFSNYYHECIEGHYKCDDVYIIIHANYEYLKMKPFKDNGYKYLAVSDFAGEKYEKIGGPRPEVFPNPVIIDDFRESILIVSATRVSFDKGKLVERMDKLANRLDDRKIPFVWLVYTNSKLDTKNKNIIKVPSRLDIIPFIRKADFVAQLSDSEACCMTALESASVGTKMLVTKIPSFYEQGLNDENSIFFDFDMSNVDECIDKMLEPRKDFKFIPKEDRWDEVLIHSKKGEIIPMKKYLVKALPSIEYAGGVYITEFGGIPKIGDEFELCEDRMEVLSTSKNVTGQPLVEVVKEVVEEFPEIKAKKRVKK